MAYIKKKELLNTHTKQLIVKKKINLHVIRIAMGIFFFTKITYYVTLC